MLERTISSENGSVVDNEDQQSTAISRLRQFFQESRYSSITTENYITVAKHFCCWLTVNGIFLSAVNETIVHQFLDIHESPCLCPIVKGCPSLFRFALGRFLTVLRQNNIAAPALNLIQPHDEILQEFGDYLISVHGVMPSSKALYVRYIRAFLMHMFSDAPAEFILLTVTNIQEYIANQASLYKSWTAKLHCTTLRAFLKFLWVTNRLENPLCEAVPTVAHWKLSTLPRHLDEDQLNTFLSSFDVNTPIGLRGFAVALLMVTMGLRSAEVANLTLDDIDWRGGFITLTKTKSRRVDHVPLTAEAGKALAEYLQKARPSTDIRNVFVTHAPPIGRALHASGIGNVIRLVFMQCLPEFPHHGPHVLRHTFATRMLRNGASLKDIADSLRHRNIETASCYAKVDINGLKRVVTPWPDVTP